MTQLEKDLVKKIIDKTKSPEARAEALIILRKVRFESAKAVAHLN